MVNEGFCFRLRQMREKKGVKRYIMSELCGLNQNAVRRFERGERIPNAQALEEIADYLDTSMDYLWIGENKYCNYLNRIHSNVKDASGITEEQINYVTTTFTQKSIENMILLLESALQEKQKCKKSLKIVPNGTTDA